MCAKLGQPDEGRDTSWASWRAVRLEAGPYLPHRGERRTNSSDRPAHATDNVEKGLGRRVCCVGLWPRASCSSRRPRWRKAKTIAWTARITTFVSKAVRQSFFAILRT